MKKCIGRLSVIATLFLCCDAKADAVGNGGDVVICYNSHGVVTSMELLDYYEGRVLRGITPKLSGADVVKKAQSVLERLKKYDVARYKNYTNRLNDFFADTLIMKNIDLVDIPDSGHLLLPNNCKIEQIAIRLAKQFPMDKAFLIDGDLWDQLDETNRAGLVLHEIIYEDFFTHGDSNSLAARYLHSILSHENALNMKLEDYYQFITKSKLDLNVYGIGIKKDKIVKPYPDAFSAEPLSSKEYFTDGQISLHVLEDYKVWFPYLGGGVTFYTDTSHVIINNNILFINGTYSYVDEYGTKRDNGGFAKVNNDGILEMLTIGPSIFFVAENRFVRIDQKVYFHDNLMIREARLESGTTSEVLCANGKKITLGGGYTARFDRKGYLTEAGYFNSWVTCN